jgi:hypothetical protein
MCRLTANALAADRSTKFLPIIVAQGFFIGTIASKLLKRSGEKITSTLVPLEGKKKPLLTAPSCLRTNKRLRIASQPNSIHQH